MSNANTSTNPQTRSNIPASPRGSISRVWAIRYLKEKALVADLLGGILTGTLQADAPDRTLQIYSRALAALESGQKPIAVLRHEASRIVSSTTGELNPFGFAAWREIMELYQDMED